MSADQTDDLLIRQYSTGMLGFYSADDTSQWGEMGRGIDMAWTAISIVEFLRAQAKVRALPTWRDCHPMLERSTALLQLRACPCARAKAAHEDALTNRPYRHLRRCARSQMSFTVSLMIAGGFVSSYSKDGQKPKKGRRNDVFELILRAGCAIL